MSLRKYDPNKVEEKVEEVKETEESKKVEEVVEAPIIETVDEKTLAEEINAKRLEYKAYADKQKKINYIITGIVCVCLVAIFAVMMVFSSTEWVLYVGIGVMALVLAATYISSKMMRKKLLASAEVYIDFLYKKTSEYLYASKDTKNFVATPKGTLEDKYFLNAHFYSMLKGTKSRNFVHFTLDGVDYDSCDLAANTVIKGKLSPKFLGRFYSIKAPIDTKEKVTLFQLKGGKYSNPLDDIENLKLVEGNDVYAIYSDDENYKKLFNDRLIKALSDFEIKAPLIDVIFSIKDNLISLGIDYEDEFLNIPVDSDFSIKNLRKSKEDFEKVLKVISVLLDNNSNKQKDSKAK